MSDIVARLSARAGVWDDRGMLDREVKAEIERLEDTIAIAKLELAAWKQSSDLKATEIERLRAEKDDWQIKAGKLLSDNMKIIEREVELEAEIERLQAAATEDIAEIAKLLAEVERLRARNKQLQDMFDRVDPEMDKLHAEIERLQLDKEAISQTASDYLHKVAELEDPHYIKGLKAEIERLRAEVTEWRECARYDPMMSGKPAFKGWDHSQMARCRKEFIEAALDGESVENPPQEKKDQ